MTFTRSAAALGAAVALAGAAAGIAGCGSSNSPSAGSSAPAKLVVWRMGGSVPSQVTWMNGVVAQFHKQVPPVQDHQGRRGLDPVGQPDHRLDERPDQRQGRPGHHRARQHRHPGRRHPGRAGQHHQRRQGLVERLGHHRGQPGQRHRQRPELRSAVVRRRARHLVQQGPVRQGRHLRAPHHLGAAGQRRQGTDEGLPRHLRPRRAEQLHQRDRQLHLGRWRPGSGAVGRQVDGAS